MSAMSEQERRRFLLDTARTAKLATVRPDGRPHVAPVWFDLDGDDLVFSTGERSVKGRNLIADPRLSICVDDEQPPFEFVIIEGRAELSRDPGALREWAGRIGARYLGVDETERLAELNGGPGKPARPGDPDTHRLGEFHHRVTRPAPPSLPRLPDPDRRRTRVVAAGCGQLIRRLPRCRGSCRSSARRPGSGGTRGTGRIRPPGPRSLTRRSSSTGS